MLTSGSKSTGGAGGKPGAAPTASTGAVASETNVAVFDEALKTALDKAEARRDQLKSADTKTKLGRLGMLEESLREIATIRRAFNGEVQLLRPQDKGPYRQALEAYDRRIQNLEQVLKFERSATEKASLLGGSKTLNADGLDPEKGSTNDQMLNATKDIQMKTTQSLVRTRQRATEARDIALEITDALASQQEQIAVIDQGVSGIDSELKRANLIMMSIAKRVATDKVVICFAFLLVFAIIAVIVVVTIDPNAVKKPTSAPVNSPASLPTTPGGRRF